VMLVQPDVVCAARSACQHQQQYTFPASCSACRADTCGRAHLQAKLQPGCSSVYIKEQLSTETRGACSQIVHVCERTWCHALLLQVHRVHALCLLAHALLHDQAASSSELQVWLGSARAGAHAAVASKLCTCRPCSKLL
jgi:hypothetical protein